jgi:phospholipid/cholesterol/gamma-HCH transport system substrate-binding protein
MTAAKDVLRRNVLVRVVVALVIAQLVALYLQKPGPARMTLTADFNRAGLNIRAGDEVRVRGLPVGTVKSIETDRKDFSARYTLSVDAGAPIAGDSGAKVVPKTLFGDKFVELDPAKPGAQSMHDGAHIPQTRTKTVTEFQQVLDRFTPALQAIDPGKFGGIISAMAAGIGDGTSLGQTATGFGLTFSEIAGHQADVATLLEHTPGAAQTFGDRAGDLTAIATNMGKVSQAMADNEPTLAKFLSSNADLLTRAGELMTTEQARINRLTANGFDVLGMVAEHPGAIAGFMKGQADSAVGLISVTHYGVMFAGIPHLIVNFPTPLTKHPGQSVDDGHTALGPEIEFNYPPPPGPSSADANPLTGLLPPLVPGVTGAGGTDPTGLSRMLQRLSGGAS